MHVNRVGLKGEDFACSFLINKGYKIISRNFNCYFGEIDIVASENKQIVFIEVKTRMNNNFGDPFEAVSSEKLIKMYKSAQIYLQKNNLSEENIRFDIVSLTFCVELNSFSVELLTDVSLKES